MTDIEKHTAIFEQYLTHEQGRRAIGIPALPLSPEQTEAVCELLQNPKKDQEEKLLYLLKERVAPGVDPSAEVKADFLGKIIKRDAQSPMISREDAIAILGTMMGGYNVKHLMEAGCDPDMAELAVKAMSHITLVYDAFEDVWNLTETNKCAKLVINSWALADWFTSKPKMPEEITVKVYKVEGEINTDDLSPAGDAWSRPDIPMHALSMGKSRFPDGIETIARWREEGFKVAFVGDVVGTGSSRKSAANSVLWHIGEDIPCVPNKRRSGVVIGGVIAPIFFNTVQDSGGLPIMADVTKLKMGDVVTIHTKKGEITDEAGNVLTTFKLTPASLEDDYRAGGRIPMIIGRSLTIKARERLEKSPASFFIETENPVPDPDQPYSLAQKMVGKACDLPGVLPGTACEPLMTTVLSQDTTGPMTADELKELACLNFQSPLFMQSFCHTAAYPRPADVKTHAVLPKFISDRKGVALKPGDGVVHSWGNRMLIPDTVGTGGDSHTRFPMGISFPAGSGLVAFAGALGFMPLDMPESVLVRFSGELNPGITLRDVVNAIPYTAIQKGLLTAPKKNKKNIFNGRILEMEGLPDITMEQAFELTDASAERSAAASCIKMSEKSVVTYLKSNVALLKDMIAKKYEDERTIQRRIEAIEEWIKNPVLLSADEGAQYAAVLEIDLAEIKEPILACPNDPDDVKLLSEVAGTKIDDVFVGSCMTNIGHFRAAARIWKDQTAAPGVRTYLCPPTRMDQEKLKGEGLFSTFNQIRARIELPGCSLCMGNQLRLPDGVNVYSTSTRNFNNRMGDGARVYLGSAELAAVVTVMGQLPTPEEYFEQYNKHLATYERDVYNYLQFDQLYR